MARGSLFAGLTEIVEGLFKARIDYFALHPATVVQQNDDTTIDVRPDPRPNGDPSPLQDMSRVPIDIGLPGAVVKVNKGTRVLIGFRGGDPTLRFAQLTGTTNVKSIAWESGEEFKCLAQKHTFDENGRGAARLGDLVAIGGGLFAKGPAGAFPCLITLAIPVAPVVAPTPWPAVAASAIVPPPPMLTPGMAVMGTIEFGPKPAVGAITTSKSSHKV